MTRFDRPLPTVLRGWWTGSSRGRRASRRLLAVGVVAVTVVAGSGPASGASAPAHPVMPNPVGAANYLAAQRAGFGPPAHAAKLGAQALARARKIRSRLIPASAGTVSFSGAWSALGPSPVTQSFYGTKNSGRVDSLAVVQTGANAGEIFAGTAGGGVWSSTDGGTTWTTTTDHVSTGLAIGALAIDPNHPSTIYAGTGEANSCGDCFYGGGVLKSTDGGSTWTVENPGGVFTGVDFASIAVDPNNSQHLFAGTSNGFYVSTDGGTSWAHPTGTGAFTNATYGIALDPTTSPTTVYIATSGVGIQKSTDGGTNFTTLSGLPAASNFGVTALGIGTKTSTYTTGNQVLYAAVQLNGATDSNGGDLSMYKTTDGGTSWSQLTIPAYTDQSYAYGSGSSDQAWYDNTLAVDPTDPNHVIAGGIAAVETTNGGTSWSNVNGGSFFSVPTNVLHPDFHAVAFTASGDAVLGCDGGVFGYSGGGSTHVTNLNTNLNTTQFYEGASVYGNGAQILGGLQDNGTVLYSGSSSWPDVLSGDGGYSGINPYDTNQQFGEADEHLYVTSDAWATAPDITPSGGLTGANFVPPMTIVPNSSAVDAPTVYYGGGDLYRTTNPTGGSSAWTKLTSVGSGVSAIAVAPSNPADLYVGFDDGTLLVSTDATSGSPTFTTISPGVGQWITHIAVDPSDPGSIAVSFSSSNTQYQSVAPMVETATVTLSATPSASYTNITGDLPTGVASNSVVFDQGELVVATDVGVFLTTSPNGSSTIWSAAGTGLPNVQVIGLSVDANGTLYAGTHGRGMWTLTPGPTVTGISPSTGPASGGTGVTITGTGFTGATAVEFGSTDATGYTVDSATQITATAPAESAGTVDVTVTTPGGTSATTGADRYTYTNPTTETLSVSESGTGSGAVGANPAGISCGSTCSHSYAYGTSVTLTATPAAGSTFAGWSGACSGTGSCTVTMDQARSVTAGFDVIPETLSVAASGAGSGAVGSSPAGIDCSSTCSHVYDYGTSVTLTASPAAGSSFAGWSGACAGTGSCTVMLDQAQSVTASFSLIPETLTVTRKGHGHGRVISSPAGISCGRTCSGSYGYGSLVTLSAKAAKRSVFVGWSGACSGKRRCTLSLTVARSVQASFHKICLVPEVKGKRLHVARRRIKADGCRVGKIRRVFSARVKKGHVIAQKPRLHRRRRYRARVELVVSKGRRH